MSVHILTTGDYEETVRRTDGDARWCFRCRKHRVFEYVRMTPVFDRSLPIDEWPTAAWYGSHEQIECSVCKTVDGDCFPGRWREWSED